MSFISEEQAKKLADWEKSHKEDCEKYFAEANLISIDYMKKKIGYHEFVRRMNDLKAKYHFLE